MEDYLYLSINPYQYMVNALIFVGSLISHKLINYKVTSILVSMWNFEDRVKFQNIDKNKVVCTFHTQVERVKILHLGPWVVKSAIFNLKIWPPNLNLEEIDFSTCYFWVQVHNLPPNHMTTDNVSRIGNFIGVMVQSPNPEQYAKMKKFIRIRVAVDVNKALKTDCFITKEDGSQL